ncbi:hypothetical protein NDU88_002305 [Pleurodeles waltl]|uniref:Uncharacterized protein n=1 Tax=Pleurodeles waltl TaxID=8319 RepID=A0AAV7TLL0_PLEWA|nr:hypothetical protein NDU88_002305 [Pleurodeles waltl]
MVVSNLPEGPSAAQTDGGPRRVTKDYEAAGGSGIPLTDGGVAPGTIAPIAQEQISQPARSVACSPTLGAPGQGMQVGLGKMMEAMHSFMASAKALAVVGMDEQGASSRREGAGRVEIVPGIEGTVRSSGENMEEGIHRHFLAAHIRQGWRRHNGTQQGGRGAEIEEEGSARGVNRIWLEAFAMLSTVIMEKFPEQGPALCKYNRVIYEEYTRNGGTGWLNYDRGFRQKMEQAPEMAWDCCKIELWVQYMGNGSRPVNSDNRFARHNQARPYFFKQQLRPPLSREAPSEGERGVAV